MPAEGSVRRRAVDRPWAAPFVVAGLVVLGGAVRLALARQDLFADELATYWIASTRSARGVVDTVASTAEITPPLSFLLSWLTTQGPSDPTLVRVPALVAGIASIPLVYLVGLRTVGRGAALLAAALATFSPFMAYYAAEARGYGVLMALLLVSTLALLLAVEDGRRRWWVLYAVAVAMAAYTHYTAVFVLAAQLAWAARVHPHRRRPLLLATAGAVLLYLPWVPSLRGDLDSPTTAILDFLSPLTASSVRATLAEWTVGFPVSVDRSQLPFVLSVSSRRDLPGGPAQVLLLLAAGVAAYGLWSTRGRLRSWFAGHGGHLGLVALLAVVTPLGALVQSLLGDNVFRTRSLAASWPYLALTVAALLTVGRPVGRAAAAALAVGAFALGTAAMLGDDFARPAYSDVAAVVDAHPGAVLVDGAALSPGPITNFDLDQDLEGTTVLRLNVPEERTRPFMLLDPRPEPATVAARAATEAEGAPIVVVASVPATSIVEELVAALPAGYELAETVTLPGLVDLQAMVFERRAPGG